MMDNVLTILKKYWGYDAFLPNQEAIINGIINKRDTVALIPTGGGKSLCFQIPAIVMKGTCLVISPLIALIDDQIQRLKSLEVNAEGLHSGLPKSQQNEIVSKLKRGELSLLYISPEKLQSGYFRNILKQIKISFVAVDEAHCISQWGYDFRPDYLRISSIKQLFPDITIAAFTATANQRTLKDIVKYLDLKKPNIIKGSFFKDNLYFGVIETEKKLKVLSLLLKEFKGSGIIYMRSRRGTVFLTDFLKKNGVNALFYHAGMDAGTRSKVQADWLDNKARVIVSTTAFGMGIDKPDVRFVIHFDLPGSIEEYYQETGRAGRDRQKSNVVLVYNKNDLSVLRKNNLDTFPTVVEINTTFNNLVSFLNIDMHSDRVVRKSVDLEEFFNYNKLDKLKSYRCINELERFGHISLNIPLRDRFSQLKFNFTPDYLDENKIFDLDEFRVLKSANLIYEGLFVSPANIVEEKIAKKAGVEKKVVVKILKKLSDNKLVNFTQQKFKFSISFLKNKEISIDRSDLLFRKKILERNIKAIQEYLEFKKCRQKYILKYFDEKLSKTCKICDICLGVECRDFSKAEFIDYKKQILDFKFDDKTDITDLMYLGTYMYRAKNFNMLKCLVDSGELAILSDKITKLKK